MRDNGNPKPNKKGKKGDARTHCKEKLALNRGSGCEKFVVMVFIEGHNHPMSSALHLFRSHRQVSRTKKVMIEQCGKATISTSKQMALLEVQSGEIGNIGCTPKDMYNVEQQLQPHLIGHDAEMLKKHFEDEKEKNDSFYFKMEIDEGRTLENFFWANAKSRHGYDLFGNVILFDTTFNTNAYVMMFAPLLGAVL
ncbi:protein FAR1-RELATED SEQUENCE 5-like [Pyrus ussuriensis x Pyrus communis]|uniref:Protein FAR1-RELATED SEQUENCE 5-like n=1 Tax=Pyrus ussuriensis x Pyrus communis TaxID=2448454 RepID=A0A5N5HVJ4_9ROSA|nr:protein FAR1-RELATED SEQUENCE 5-like [Pyrus ussuriensis x Pyrus communis]